MGNLLDLPGFDYVSSEEILDELQLTFDSVDSRDGDWPIANSVAGSTEAANVRSIYQVDSLVRRAKALQSTTDGQAGNGGEQ